MHINIITRTIVGEAKWVTNSDRDMDRTSYLFVQLN